MAPTGLDHLVAKPGAEQLENPKLDHDLPSHECSGRPLGAPDVADYNAASDRS